LTCHYLLFLSTKRNVRYQPGLLQEPHPPRSYFVYCTDDLHPSLFHTSLALRGFNDHAHRPADVVLDCLFQPLSRRQLWINTLQRGQDAVHEQLDTRTLTDSLKLRFKSGLHCPHPSCPSTTNSGVCRWTPVYCRLPATSGEMMFPATRTTNSSPSPTSKIHSGGTRESLHPRIVAKGCCPRVSRARVASIAPDIRTSPFRKRLFPSMRR
jgi:hypothetical protein